MDEHERNEIINALTEELQAFFSWTIDEVGAEYYIEDTDQASASLELEAAEKNAKRINSQRVHLWERDWYSFFHHPQHPSIYNMLKEKDLEIVHYLEEISCEHFRTSDLSDSSERNGVPQKNYDQSFGVLLASEKLRWLYRLDFCEVCGLVEIWSMEYNPDEVAFYKS